MKRIFIILYCQIFIVSILFYAGCSSSGKNRESMQISNMTTVLEEKIPAGHCRIAATVLSIDETHISADPENPCSQAPCMTQVEVEQVLGYGSGFNGNLSKGQKLALRFALTTTDTKVLNLKLDNHLPGISAGERFQGDIEYRPIFGGGGEYVVYFYEVVSD